jgi:enediyne biosynthesis protein E4
MYRHFTPLDYKPNQLIQFLLLCFLCQGLPSCRVNAQHTTAPPEPAAGISAAVPQFTDITQASGVTFEHRASHTSKKYLLETMGSGVALFDYDNDGRLDLFLVNGAKLNDPEAMHDLPKKAGPSYFNRLYHQRQDGSFEDVTLKAGVAGSGYGMGTAVGDYDNDGYEDLYVTGYGHNTLYHNNGDGTFTDVTAQAGVGASGWSSSAIWFDFDNDGKLDLVVGRYLDWDFDDIWCGQHLPGYRGYCHPDTFKPITLIAYHNDGGGHFSDWTNKAGLDKPGRALGLAIADYDHDGRTDLFVANDSMLEFLYHNQGNGKFKEEALDAGVSIDGDGNTYAGMGVDFQDYNNDGWSDLIVTSLAGQQYALYDNHHDGTFTYASESTGIGRITAAHSGMGILFFDYDNDGWKDLVATQGHVLDNIQLTHPDQRYLEPLLLARNDSKQFIDVSKSAGAIFQKPLAGRGLAIGDINNDGKMDFVVTTNDGRPYLLRNDTLTRNHWILLNLVGHTSNRDGIGAVVKLTTSSGEQYRTMTTGSSYLSSSDKRVHFGMGTDSVATTIEIDWPSGIVQSLHDVRADQILRVDEPAGSANERQ